MYNYKLLLKGKKLRCAYFSIEFQEKRANHHCYFIRNHDYIRLNRQFFQMLFAELLLSAMTKRYVFKLVIQWWEFTVFSSEIIIL